MMRDEDEQVRQEVNVEVEGLALTGNQFRKVFLLHGTSYSRKTPARIQIGSYET